MAAGDHRYEVPILQLERAMRVPRSLQQELKGVVSAKMMARMKKEAVDCPVLGRRVPFLQCFNCPNFVRRVRGVVHCKGEPLEG